MTDVKNRLIALLLGCLFLGAVQAQTGPQKLASIRLNAGIHNIQAEVAQTPDERDTGLMFRTAMGPNDGMLFVFEQPGQQCFWMKNTLIPLSVAFIADDGRIVNIDDDEAADARQPLLHRPGALRPRDEHRLVRQAGHQARYAPARRAVRPLEPVGDEASRAGRLSTAAAGARIRRSCAPRSPS